MPKKTKLFLEVFRGRDSKILKKNSDYSELLTDFAQSGDNTTFYTVFLGAFHTDVGAFHTDVGAFRTDVGAFHTDVEVFLITIIYIQSRLFWSFLLLETI